MSSSFPEPCIERAPEVRPAAPRRRRRRSVPLGRPQLGIEWAALLLLGAVVTVGPWLYGSTRAWAYGPLLAAVAVSCVLVALRPCLFPRERVVRIPPAMPVFVVLLVWELARLPFAASRHDAGVAMVRLASYVAAYACWTELLVPRRRRRAAIGAVILAASAMAWYAIVQDGHGSRMVLAMERPEQYGLRASGAYLCPNHFAALLVGLAPVCLALAVTRDHGLPLRIVAGYGLAVFLFPIYLTGSRSGWLGLAAGLAVALVLLAARRGWGRFLLALVGGPAAMAAAGYGLWVASPLVRERVQAALHGDVRLDLWKDTLAMIAERPWLGNGTGAFRWMYPWFQKHLVVYVDPRYPHNEFLQRLAEAGIAGLVLSVAAIGMLLVLLAWRARRIERTDDAALLAGAAGAVAGSLVHGLFDFTLNLFANVHVLVLLAGAASAAVYDARLRAPRPLPLPAAWTLAAGAAVAAAAAALFGLGLAAAHLRTNAAEAAQADMDWEGAERGLRAAARFAPLDHLPWLALGDLRRRQASWLHQPSLRAQVLAEARAFYAAAARRNPHDPEVVFGTARCDYLAGDAEAALQAMAGLAGRLPLHLLYQSEYGDLLAAAGRLDEAIAVYERALRVKEQPEVRARLEMALRRKAAAATPPAGARIGPAADSPFPPGAAVCMIREGL
jgi:O-antigen ligase